MKVTKFFIACFVIILFLSVSGFSQDSQPPLTWRYNFILFNDNQPPLVSGIAGTGVEFTSYPYPWEDFDPWIYSYLFRTDDPETALSEGEIRGFSDIVPAEGQHAVLYAQSGYAYCVRSTHKYIFVRYNYTLGRWFDIYRVNLGSSEACHTFPVPPTPTPTPTPCDPANALSCQTPTPTPNTTPTPTPTVKITEVGFTGDRKIKRFEPDGDPPYIDFPDGTVSTWKTNNNPKLPVAYRKGTNPTLFAKFSITPALTTSMQAQIRVLRGNSIVTSSPIPVTLNGNEVRVNGISIPFSNLEAGEFVKKSEYKFTWQISFDNGSNWRELDKKTDHDVHWLFSNPPDEDLFKPFKNLGGTQYEGLFDFALKKSTGQNTRDEPDIKKVIQKINAGVEREITYNPTINSYNANPLEILDGENEGEAVCQDNALVLLGLLKSIGLDEAQEKFHWGGEESTGKRNYYCPPGGCGTITPREPLGNRLTMQTKRDILGCQATDRECLPENPSFTHHATVVYDNRSFDPSYGIVEANIELLTAVNVPPAGQPQCVYRSAANALRVTRNSFGVSAPTANNDTNKICSSIASSNHAKAKLFRFDRSGGADTAIVRGKTGEWIVMNEFQEATVIPPLGFNPTQDALAPADYDGDGLLIPAVWYANGDFFYLMSSNYYKQSPLIWKVKDSEERAVPGDYDGDRISDFAAWRATNGRWFIHRSSDNTDVEIQWGTTGDIPVPGDYDNDGKTDIAIWRPSTGDWWIVRSSDSGYSSVNFGMQGDIAVQGDYDGDGTTDYAVVRPSTGVWYFLESENGYQFRAHQCPVLANDDLPVPADYNGDSETDVAVFFRSTGMWQIVDSQTGEIVQQYLGRIDDTPVMSASVFK